MKKEKEYPRVSVIITTYNRAEKLEKALKSVFSQSFQDFEVVVVDDASEDGTSDLLRRYQRRDKRLRYITHQQNFGSDTRGKNEGILMAKGEYIAFLDSDDTYLPEAIKNLVHTLQNTDAGFVFSPVTEIYPDQKEIINYPIAKDNPDNFAAEHLVNTNVYIHACLFRREVFEKERMDETMHYNEDSDFLQRVAINFRAVYCNEPTVNHYHHQENKSKNRTGILQALIYSLNKIRTEYPAFYSANRNAAERRRQTLYRSLTEQYILQKNYKKARELSRENKTGFFIRSSIWLKSPVLLKLGRKLGMNS